MVIKMEEIGNFLERYTSKVAGDIKTSSDKMKKIIVEYGRADYSQKKNHVAQHSAEKLDLEANNIVMKTNLSLEKIRTFVPYVEIVYEMYNKTKM